MDIHRMGRHPTETQTLEIACRRVRLQHTIDEFIAGAQRYLGDDYDEDNNIQDMDVDFAGNPPDSTNEESDDVVEPGGNPQVLFQPEHVLIPLPSNLGRDRCEELGIGGLMRQKITLREGQANDMLHAIRVHLADKAVLFRTMVHPARSQVTTT
jgi:hypothetical protein